MPFLRFLMVLSLVVWLGGLIFFAFVLAPTAFSPGILPTRHMAGSIVGRSLDGLHYMAIISGIIFLITSILHGRMASGNARPLAARHVLVVLMLLLTVISQFAISPKMHAIRVEVGVIDDLPLDNPLRVEFNRLHMVGKIRRGGALDGVSCVVHDRASFALRWESPLTESRRFLLLSSRAERGICILRGTADPSLRSE